MEVKELKEKLAEIDKRYVNQKNQRDVLAGQLNLAEQEMQRLLGEYRAIDSLIKEYEEKKDIKSNKADTPA